METIKLLFTGDIAPVIRPEIDAGIFLPTTYRFTKEVKDLLKSGFAIGNLETTVTESRDYQKEKPVVYRMPCRKDILYCYRYLNLANNHILDYGLKGMKDTQECLERFQILYTGCGLDEEEAASYLIINHKGFKIAIFSATDHPTEWEAGTGKPGVSYIETSQLGLRKIKQILNQIKKRKPDITIFSYHYGSNYQKSIQPFKNFFYQVLKLGVDIIHGHSAHHINQVEFFEKPNIFNKNCLIIYANGDFIDDYGFALKRDTGYHINLAFILELTVHPSSGEWKIQVIPTQINYTMKNNHKYYGEVKDAETALVKDVPTKKLIYQIIKSGFRSS